MALHFERSEYLARIERARLALRQRDLAALLIFAQESHYYLTGFDTSGFVFFQCGVLTADDGRITLLTRLPDREQAGRTSIIEDVRIWYDRDGADPTEELKAILDEKGLKGSRVGIELNTFGLTGFNYERIRRRLSDWCELVDASDVVRGLRVAKSPAEIVYVRRSASLADDALLAMLDAARPSAFEGAIAAAGSSVILRSGGDPPPSGPVLGSGDRALLVRSATGFRHLDAVDQLTMEFAASYRHYCACLMRTIAIGKADLRQRKMFEATREAIDEMTAAARPGHPLGEIDDAHRRVLDTAGYRDSRLAACGYSLGATFRPSWMDVPPMIYSGNLTLARPGMVLFLHAILVDANNNLAMSLGHTVLLTDTGSESLSRFVPEFTLCQ
jgi:Xaa-Pro aminopeptidase